MFRLVYSNNNCLNNQMVAEGRRYEINGVAAFPITSRGTSGPQLNNQMLEKEKVRVRDAMVDIKNFRRDEGVLVGGAAPVSKSKDAFLYYPSLYEGDTDHQNAADHSAMCRSLSEGTGFAETLKCTERIALFDFNNCSDMQAYASGMVCD